MKHYGLWTHNDKMCAEISNRNTPNTTQLFRIFQNQVLITCPQYIYFDSKLLASLMQWYTKVHLFPSWLVWGRNQVYCACCSAKTAHKQIVVNIYFSPKKVYGLLKSKVFGKESTVKKMKLPNFGPPSGDSSSKIGRHFSK